MQRLLREGPLLDNRGRLMESGYHTRLIKSYDRTLVKNKWLRRKEWDYYYVGNRNYGIALTVADNGYMTLISVSLLDYNTKKDITRTLINFLPFKGFNLPEDSNSGDIHIRKKHVDLAFVHENGKRHLTLKMDDFDQGLPIDVDLTLKQMNQDTMVIAVPFENPKRFYYNQKINLLKASGKVTFGEETFDFSKDCLGVLDWGRGAWPYHVVWYWSSLSAYYENTHIGFNLGCGFGTDLKATENMLFVGEQTYKLEEVVFDIPKEGGQFDYLGTWRIYDKHNMIDLTFSPVYDRKSHTNALVIKSNQHQVFGTFEGAFKVEGKTINIDKLFGFVERIENKW